MEYKIKRGSRTQVMNQTAEMTTGGLKYNDLKYNSQGRIVSKKKSAQAKKEKRLEKAGWTYKKGEFGAVRIEDKPKTGSKKKASKKKGSKKKKK